MNQNIFILIGSNLGNRVEHLNRGIDLIGIHAGKLSKCSSIYETEAWGKIDQPAFLNQVIEIESDLSAKELLDKCLVIEKEMGRIRVEKWEARIIDIDLLYFDEEIIETEDLIIPHPRLHQRKFTLIPLVEISPAFVHPILKKTNKQLLDGCQDQLAVKIFKG